MSATTEVSGVQAVLLATVLGSAVASIDATVVSIALLRPAATSTQA